MPIYEYRCNSCGRKSSFFVRSISSPLEPVCSTCGSGAMTRTMSSFAHHRTLKDTHEASGPPTLGGGDWDYYKDPRNIGRWAEEKFKEFGQELPPEVRERIDAARGGELPKELDL